MNTVTLHFKADNQQLTALDGLYKLASNTVEYVKAIFTLGENWAGFDVVRAAWYTDFECISTVLDGNGECFVPWEVLSRPEGVTINLYGCDLEEESDGEAVLVDRLTTYPVKAILVDVDARVCGSETKPVTPSQFEQYIAIVQELVGTVRDITSCVLNPDYTLTINYSDDTSDTVGPIRGEQGEQGPTGPAGNGISKIEKISTAGLVDTYRITFTNGTHKDYTVTNGAKGDTGNGIESIYLTGTSGAVKTYTILFTNGDTFEYQVTDGEVTRAELEAVLPTDTASGAIASFPDGSDLFDYLSCIVDIEPVQDLHGYDKPWVGGAGKNKLDLNVTAYDINGVKISQEDDGIKIVVNNASGYPFTKIGTLPASFPSGTYYFKPTQTIAGIGYRVVDRTVSPAVVIFADSGTIPSGHNELYVEIAGTGSLMVNGTYSVKVGLMTEDIDYSPYANICPITGWTGCEVDVAGVNVWDEEWEVGSIGAGGINASDNTKIRSKNYIPVLPNTTYYIKSPAMAYIWSYDADKNCIVSSATGKTNATYTTASNERFIRFRMDGSYGTTYNNDISINYPSTDHDYHAYNPNSAVYPVSWQTEAGTVYGGTVDLVTGVLTVELGSYTCPANVAITQSAIGGQTTVRYYFDNKFADCKTGETVYSLCDGLKLLDESAPIAYSKDEVGYYINGQRVYVKLNVSTVEEAQALLNGLTFHYELATPTTIQLTPTQIHALLGQNNVWADCGDTSVTYKADVQRWVEKKLGA